MKTLSRNEAIPAQVIPPRPLFRVIASLVQARLNCIASDNQEWLGKHEERILSLVKEYMPSGSGIDCGTKIDLDASNADKLVFTLSFHHMDDNGFYDGWTDHTLTVKPSLTSEFDLSFSGRNRNEIKEYLHDVYGESLGEMIPHAKS